MLADHDRSIELDRIEKIREIQHDGGWATVIRILQVIEQDRPDDKMRSALKLAYNIAGGADERFLEKEGSQCSRCCEPVLRD